MKAKKKNFASFNQSQAFKQLNISRLKEWQIAPHPVKLSDFFHQRLARLKRFDLRSSEKAKELLIDAICEEALEDFTQLKIWKGTAIESDVLRGTPDYIIAENKDYLDAPILCIVEAKKDNFTQGLAQCLVEMQACQWNNQQINKTIDVFGIVTNGEGWKFYKLTPQGEVYETLLYSVLDMEILLGTLHYIFEECGQNLGVKSD
ncbi:hypothetical protein [Limnofasciculus baicalensis]|uniref:Uncharacterized protein n=1 Tax=Limnofasciculus baicalensis BBK-W-15 TaxID=2699891 RepID=A0AAE3GRT8_9CYAN|nr:hypothetical protein [Limnofasciculus baicalensis]MCP2729144.1 hypothetical protein [Limnofasciculus baicalensis BBK-W-15]